MPNKETNSREVMVLEHDADGIQELDNLLPRWWLWSFYIAIIFAIGYMAYYHVFNAGDLQVAEYQKEMKAGDQIKVAAMANFEKSLGSAEPSKDAGVLANGQAIFATSCAPCHRADAGGLVGPNLTDTYWIHGDTYGDTLKTIWNGVPEKGMVTWKGVLKPDQIEAVASYIFGLRGSNPANPKPPENQQTQPTGPSEFE